MNLSAVTHEQNRKYRYPEARDQMRFRLKAAKKDLNSCKIHIWNRFDPEYIKNQTVQMKCVYRDQNHDYFEITAHFEKPVSYIRYLFELSDGNETFWLGANGLTKEKPESGFFNYLCTNEGDVFKLPLWAKDRIIYQIFPERFYNGNTQNDPAGTMPWNSTPTRQNFMGGDIKGIIGKIDYLKDLGVNCLYLTPIFEAPSNHKYDTINYFKIDPAFGTEEDLSLLVKLCHEQGIKVILDGVFNHCGFGFPYFQDVYVNGKASPYADWFYIKEFPLRQNPPNYECVGYFCQMPKLKLSQKPVADYVLEIMKYWIEKTHIDGWRLDVADEVEYRFWQRARLELKELYPDCFLIAETWIDGSSMLLGDQFDSVMNYLFRDAVVDYIAKSAIKAEEFDFRINKMLATYGRHVSRYLYNLIGSHDTPRFLRECRENKQRLMMAAAVQMTFPGIPAIYYGDEVGMTGDNDPDCRGAMIWDPSLQDAELLSWYRRLIKLRQDQPALVEGEFLSNLCDSEKSLYGYIRSSKDEHLYIIINNSEEPCIVMLPVVQGKGTLTELLTNESARIKRLKDSTPYYNHDLIAYGGIVEIAVPPLSIKIFK